MNPNSRGKVSASMQDAGVLGFFFFKSDISLEPLTFRGLSCVVDVELRFLA